MPAPLIDLGTRLREARQRRGRTLRDIAAITRIPTAWLAAIERNEFDRLPKGLYRRAYVRAFAAEMGIDPEPLPDALLSNPDVHLANALDGSFAAWRSRVPTLLTIGLLLTVFLLTRGIWESGEARLPAGPAPRERGALPTSPVAADRQPETPAAAGARASLELRFVGPCWVSASIDGKRTIHRLVPPGERLVLEAFEEIAVDLGDAGSVELSINGGPVRVPGAPGEVVRLMVEPPLDAAPAGTEA